MRLFTEIGTVQALLGGTVAADQAQPVDAENGPVAISLFRHARFAGNTTLAGKIIAGVLRTLFIGRTQAEAHLVAFVDVALERAAFFIASAAYRAFIGRTVESNLLLAAAVLVMLGNTTFGSLMTGWLPESLNFLHLPKVSEFIMAFPTTAGQRAIMIGAGLGIIGSSLRIILGIERSYLGGE